MCVCVCVCLSRKIWVQNRPCWLWPAPASLPINYKIMKVSKCILSWKKVYFKRFITTVKVVISKVVINLTELNWWNTQTPVSNKEVKTQNYSWKKSCKKFLIFFEAECNKKCKIPSWTWLLNQSKLLLFLVVVKMV